MFISMSSNNMLIFIMKWLTRPNRTILHYLINQIVITITAFKEHNSYISFCIKVRHGYILIRGTRMYVNSTISLIHI
jgi:hypothetical protein